MDCIFCKIIAGQIPARKLFEDEDTLCFMDVAPAAPGHCLVVPKLHYVRFAELSAAHAASVGASVARAAQILEKVGYTDYNILNNNGAAAGQAVGHVHMHLIPKPSAEQGLLGHFAKPEVDVEAEFARLMQE